MKRHPSLPRQIGHDLRTAGLVPLILLVLVLVSALSVVYTTQLSRQLVSRQDQLLMEKDNLDIEWRNLILEETALSEHSRVESMAIKRGLSGQVPKMK